MNFSGTYVEINIGKRFGRSKSFGQICELKDWAYASFFSHFCLLRDQLL